jgi:hypothetical protein
MSTSELRGLGTAAAALGRSAAALTEHNPAPNGHTSPAAGPASRLAAPELARALAEVKGQAQFLLYLADQIDDSIAQLVQEADPGHASFLAKLLGMYSSQLESKHQGLGDKIAETCQEVYLAMRDLDLDLDA